MRTRDAHRPGLGRTPREKSLPERWGRQPIPGGWELSFQPLPGGPGRARVRQRGGPGRFPQYADPAPRGTGKNRRKRGSPKRRQPCPWVLHLNVSHRDISASLHVIALLGAALAGPAWARAGPHRQSRQVAPRAPLAFVWRLRRPLAQRRAWAGQARSRRRSNPWNRALAPPEDPISWVTKGDNATRPPLPGAASGAPFFCRDRLPGGCRERARTPVRGAVYDNKLTEARGGGGGVRGAIRQPSAERTDSKAAVRSNGRGVAVRLSAANTGIKGAVPRAGAASGASVLDARTTSCPTDYRLGEAPASTRANLLSRP